MSHIKDAVFAQHVLSQDRNRITALSILTDSFNDHMMITFIKRLLKIYCKNADKTNTYSNNSTYASRSVILRTGAWCFLDICVTIFEQDSAAFSRENTNPGQSTEEALG